MNVVQSCYFTICIPSYNRAYTLNRCLDSLVNQTYKDFEVVFVDDGSTDDTETVVNEYNDKLNIRYYKKTNGGKHTALNVGIRNATDTELFMILDSDDWLKPNALEFFYQSWKRIKVIEPDEQCCGVMARCADQEDKIIGALFPKDPCRMDYVTFHFSGVDYGDCNECIKTSIIKQYLFPEPPQTKFVPEYYVFDQLGVKYELYCTNLITKNTEYSSDGITRNADEHIKRNWMGYFYATTCRLEKIVPFTKGRISNKQILTMWYNYWRYCYYDVEHIGERVSHITMFGVAGKILYVVKRLLVALSIKKEV